MPDDERRLRTMFLTYEADDETADTFMIVVGSVAENFRGVSLVEYQDDTVFAEHGATPMEMLHELSTNRLTEQQRAEIAAFTAQIDEWELLAEEES